MNFIQFFMIYAVVFSNAVIIKLFSEYILNNFLCCNRAALSLLKIK